MKVGQVRTWERNQVAFETFDKYKYTSRNGATISQNSQNINSIAKTSRYFSTPSDFCCPLMTSACAPHKKRVIVRYRFAVGPRKRLEFTFHRHYFPQRVVLAS